MVRPRSKHSFKNQKAHSLRCDVRLKPSNLDTQRVENEEVINNIYEQCGLGSGNENLDFEPEEESYGKLEDFTDFDRSCHRICNDETTSNSGNFNERILITCVSNKTVEVPESTCSSYRSEMLSSLNNNALDDRQNEYLPLQINVSSTTFLDSSDESISDSDRDENETEKSPNDDWHMTPEEEASLLEDEDMNEYFHTETNGDFSESLLGVANNLGNALICVSGDKRTLISANQIPNSLKRTIKNVSQFEKVKKAKWNKKLADNKPLRVFLEDLGYESQLDKKSQRTHFINTITEFDSIHDGDTEKVIAEVSKPSTFRIILNTDTTNRVCQKVDSTLSPTMPTDNSPSGNNTFKIPLPPAKRPPTRPKKTSNELSGSRSESSENNSYIIEPIHTLSESEGSCAGTISNLDCSFQTALSRTPDLQDDDIISIAAPSLRCTDGKFDQESIKEELDVDERMTNPFDEPNNRVSTWIQGVQPPPPVLQSFGVQQTQNTTVLGSNESNGVQRIPFRNVPLFFTGLCYYYYMNQYCAASPRCSHPHTISVGKFLSRAIKYSPDRLLDAYNFLNQYKLKRLYTEIHGSFIKGFAHHKMRNELICCINDFYIFEVNLFDSINMVVLGLQETGLSFQESIESMVMTLGLRQPQFGDILLELLTSKPDITENWQMIKKIIRTLNVISPKLAKKILHSATNIYPLDRNLLLDMNEVIIKNKLTDLLQISEDILAPFKTLADFNENIIPKLPRLQQVTRLPLATKIFTLPARQSHNDMDRFEHLQRNKNNNVRNMNKNRQKERRNCDFTTGKITTSYDSNGSTDSDDRLFEPTSTTIFHRFQENSNPSAPTSSTSSRASSVCSDNNYVSQLLFTENRQDIDCRSVISNKEVDYQLSPSPPVIGITRLPENFVYNKSLHYLLPELVTHKVSLDEYDHHNLKRTITEIDPIEFLHLLHKYRDLVTLENFIIMVVINLKDNLENATRTLKDMLNHLEVDTLDSQTKKLLKIVFEVTVMNLLMELEKLCYWNDAVQLLEQFSDWDGLASSQTFGSKQLTHMGKYIYLSQLFSKGRNFHYTYRILMCPELKLMKSPSTWPFFNCVRTDVNSRNGVLDDFLREGYSNYLLGVLQIHKYLLTSAEVHGFNRRQQQEYLNSMLVYLLEKGRASNLTCCFNFLDCFYKILDKGLLRSLASTVVERLGKSQIIHLYELCCNREIYQLYSGEESAIIIRTDHSDNEIKLIFTFFFYKKSQTPLSSMVDLYIFIKLPESSAIHTKIYRNTIRSINEVNAAVKTIIRDDFHMLVRDSSNCTELQIPAEELSTVLMEQCDWQNLNYNMGLDFN